MIEGKSRRAKRAMFVGVIINMLLSFVSLYYSFEVDRNQCLDSSRKGFDSIGFRTNEGLFMLFTFIAIFVYTVPFLFFIPLTVVQL